MKLRYGEEQHLYSAINSPKIQRRWWHQVKTMWTDGSWGVVWRCSQR